MRLVKGMRHRIGWLKMRLSKLRPNSRIHLEVTLKSGRLIYLPLLNGNELENLENYFLFVPKNADHFSLWHAEGPNGNLVVNANLGDRETIKSMDKQSRTLFFHASILTLNERYSNYRKDFTNVR